MEAILPHLRVLVVQVLTFVLGMTVIWKLYIASLRDHLKARRDGIAKDLSEAAEVRAEAGRLREQIAQDRLKMAEELKAARQAAEDEVAKIRADLLAKAQAQQDRLIQQARAQIEAETAKAAAELRAQTARLVVEAAGALVAKKLDGPSDLALAERLVGSVRAPRA